MTDYKQLCAELVNTTGTDFLAALDRASTALAKSEPQPADSEVAELVERLRDRAAGNDRFGAPKTAALMNRAAELLKRLMRYEQALSAVMPSDFKDWHENSRDEWPDVAAGLITNLRKQEELAWEQLDRLELSLAP